MTSLLLRSMCSGLADKCGVEGDSHFVAASSYTRAAINNRQLFKQGEERGRKGGGEVVLDKENKPMNSDCWK